MAAMAGPGGMLPEQVWDAGPIPHRHLAPDTPTGSATPLAWAHAEYVKLAHSILDGRPVDRPEPLWARYHGYRPSTYLWYWSPQAPLLASVPDSIHRAQAPAVADPAEKQRPRDAAHPHGQAELLEQIDHVNP